jgi:transcription initiation factor TFIIIB Brf1 subunit/transcription initiation factor TFIIB
MSDRFTGERCPKCGSGHTYRNHEGLVCRNCGHVSDNNELVQSTVMSRMMNTRI